MLTMGCITSKKKVKMNSLINVGLASRQHHIIQQKRMNTPSTPRKHIQCMHIQ